MEKTIKNLSVALAFAILAMAFTCNYIVTTGNTIQEDNIDVSRIDRAEMVFRDTVRLKDLEILRGDARRKGNTDQQAEIINAIAESNFKLPASLQYIDDEAFEGTALVNVDIPENVEYIGERAFSDIPTFRMVNIPEKTTYIARSAFSGSSRVTITGAPDSYARKYARENGIPFAPLTVMYANAGAGSGISLNQARISDEVTDAVEDDGQNDNEPADRIAGEIKANITENGAAYHITGRAPPVNA